MAKSKWPQVQEKLLLVKAWARDGLTDVNIAKNLGISQDTLYVYKKEHAEFSEALRAGKEVADVIMENAAYNRGVGYDVDEVTTEITLGANGKELSRKVKKIKKHIPGDPGTQQWWLQNRKPDTWRQRQREKDGSDEGMMSEYLELLRTRNEKQSK